MKFNKRKPIVISGSHRSGSTWVGKVIAKSPQVNYIHEPFNIGIPRKNSPLKFWFEYIDQTTSRADQTKVLKYLESFYNTNLLQNVKRAIGVRNKEDLQKLIYKRRLEKTARPLIKDPISLLSLPWLYSELNADVVVCIRHPAAFVASLKMKNWTFDFQNLLGQPKLMLRLERYREEIELFSKESPDIIKQGSLLWNILYTTVDQYRKVYNKDWLFVRNEDLSLDPAKSFQAIFNYLNLSFDEPIQEYLVKSTNAEEKSKLFRNSKKNISSWKSRLDLKEIKEIKFLTREVYPLFYSENDWT